MKLDLRKYELNKHYTIEDDVDFSSHIFSKDYRIRKIISCHIKIDLVVFEYLANVSLKMKGKAIGACSYTNEDVELDFEAHENMTFSDSEDAGADYIEKDDLIDLDPYLLSLIDNALPLNIVKKGATLPKSGNGYVVMSEEDYFKNKKKNNSNPWDELDKLNLSK